MTDVLHILGDDHDQGGSYRCSCGWRGTDFLGHFLSTGQAEIEATLRAIAGGTGP